MADETEPTTNAEDTTDVAAAVVTAGAYALIVADFSDIDAAWEAYDELDRAVDAASLEIEGVLVLKKDSDGSVEVQKLTDHSARRGLTWGVVGGVVAGVLFPPSIIGSAALLGAAGAGIGGLQSRHHRKELAEELTDAIDPGHSGLVLLVSDPAVVELQQALAKADHIVQKAIDKAAAEEIKAEANTAQATEGDSATG
jgi:uncharacterized membrane protein